MDIDISQLQENKSVFWSEGNEPTQALLGLDYLHVLSHLKALILLYDVVIASSSFFYESSITRKITTEFGDFFSQGNILYFIEEGVKDYKEHAKNKRQFSPKELICYQDPNFLDKAANHLESLGKVLRRPTRSLSDDITKIWCQEIFSNDKGTIGSFLTKNTGKDAFFYKKRLSNIAVNRDVTFVWEYLQPMLLNIGLPPDFLPFFRRKLLSFYAEVTANLISANLDRHDITNKFQSIESKSKYDTSLFIECLGILGVEAEFNSLTAREVLSLKSAPSFLIFREFYFSMIDNLSIPRNIKEWLPIYHKAARTFANKSISRDEFLLKFAQYIKKIEKPKKYNNPMEIILSACEIFDNKPIDDMLDIIRNPQVKAFTVSSIQNTNDNELTSIRQERYHQVAQELRRKYKIISYTNKELEKELSPRKRVAYEEDHSNLIKEISILLEETENLLADDATLNLLDYKDFQLERETVTNEVCAYLENGSIENEKINEILSYCKEIFVELDKQHKLQKIDTKKIKNLIESELSATGKLMVTLPLFPVLLAYRTEFSINLKAKLSEAWGKILAICRFTR